MLFLVCLEIACHTHTLYNVHCNLKRLTARFQYTCSSLGVTYWCTAGTLLGLVREGDIIHHDDDVDLCVSISDLKILRTNNPTHIKPLIGEWTGIWRYTQPDIGGCLDIFPSVMVDGVWKYTGNAAILWPKENYSKLDIDNIEQWPWGKYKTTEGKIVGISINAPNNMAKYAHQQFGEGWTIPKVTNIHTAAGFRYSYFYPLTFGLVIMGAIITVFTTIHQVRHNR